MLFVLMIAVALGVGVPLADNHGQSWDEHSNQVYGDLYLRAYEDPSLVGSGDIQAYYDGPAYFMASSIASAIARSLNPNWSRRAARHFVAFSTFLVGIGAFYLIARRWISAIPAAIASALFLTQPLFFGHAFINLKDLPFTTFFLVTFGLGLAAYDALEIRTDGVEANSDHESDREPLRKRVARQARRDWRRTSGAARISAFALLVFGVWLIVDALAGRFLIESLLSSIELAYRGEALPPINAVFRRIATSSSEVALNSYLAKARTWFEWGRILLVAIGAGMILGPIQRLFPAAIRELGLRKLKPMALFAFAGVSLGVSISVRLAAPWAGLLITGLALHRHRSRAIPYLIAFWMLAAVACIATWPLLWQQPLQTFWSRVVATGEYSGRPVRYFGQEIASGNLPWHYLPVLLAIQLTEPILPLAALGVYALYRRHKELRPLSPEWIAVCVWFFLPAGAIVLFPIGIYNNFRQVFFLIPPLFFLAGMGVDLGLERIGHAPWKLVLAAILLFPGLVRIVHLHPYEYIHYNGLVGGFRGASRSFEMDYWCTSYRTAVEHLNEIAEQRATVTVWGPLEAARAFSRPDLQFTWHDRDTPPETDYVLGCDRVLDDPDFYATYETIAQMTHLDVQLSVIKVRP